jgi:hypothetical protein
MVSTWAEILTQCTAYRYLAQTSRLTLHRLFYIAAAVLEISRRMSAAHLVEFNALVRAYALVRSNKKSRGGQVDSIKQILIVHYGDFLGGNTTNAEEIQANTEKAMAHIDNLLSEWDAASSNLEVQQKSRSK